MESGQKAMKTCSDQMMCRASIETSHSCMGLVSMVAWYRFVVLFRDFTRLKSGNH